MSDSSRARDNIRGIMLLVASVSLFGIVHGLSKILVETQSFGQIVLARYSLALPVLLMATNPARLEVAASNRKTRLAASPGNRPAHRRRLDGHCRRLSVAGGSNRHLICGPVHRRRTVRTAVGRTRKRNELDRRCNRVWAVLLVARPGFAEVSRFAALPFLAALFYALFQLMTRHLATANEHPTTTLAWTLAVGLLAATPVALATWVPLTPTEWLLSLSLGVVFGIAQLLLVRAFSYAPANVLAPFSYVQIIAATLFGLIAFHDVPDHWTILGIILIIAAAAYVMKDAGHR
jgi:drug/metabolite transporter (DMT)-like permease